MSLNVLKLRRLLRAYPADTQVLLADHTGTFRARVDDVQVLVGTSWGERALLIAEAQPPASRAKRPRHDVEALRPSERIRLREHYVASRTDREYWTKLVQRRVRQEAGLGTHLREV